MSKKVIFAAIVVILIMPTLTWADTGAGIKPSSRFYFFDITSERLNLIFTFNTEKKANKALGHAEERLEEAKEEAESNKPKAVEKAMKNYESSISLATEESKGIKSESEAETLLNTISSNTSKHQEILKDVYNKVPDEAKDAILKAMEVIQKRQEQADRQIGELRKEVVLLKDELKELQEKIKEKENESKTQNNELLKTKAPTLSSAPTPITETGKSLKELKDELEKKLKELEKTPTSTPTSTPVKVEVVNQNPILVQVVSPTPIYSPTHTPTPSSMPSITPSPTPTPTPSPTPTPTPVIPGTLISSLSKHILPVTTIIYGGSATDVSKFTLSSTEEAFSVTRLSFGTLEENEKLSASSNIHTLSVSYKDKNGNSRMVGQSFPNSGIVTFTWDISDLYKPYVPKDGTLELSINIALQSVQIRTGGTFSINLIGNSFRAIGEESDVIISSIDNIISNNYITIP